MNKFNVPNQKREQIMDNYDFPNENPDLRKLITKSIHKLTMKNLQKDQRK